MSMSMQISDDPPTKAPRPPSETTETPAPTSEQPSVPTQEESPTVSPGVRVTEAPSSEQETTAPTESEPSTESGVSALAASENNGDKRVLIGAVSGAGVAVLAVVAAVFARRKKAVSGKASATFSVSDVSTEADGEIQSAVAELY